jgi:hypothetical protein
VQFGGYDHRVGAGDGTLWDMDNLTGDDYPVLSTRKPRRLLSTLTSPRGLYVHDGLYTVDGTTLYKDGTAVVVGLSNSDKTLCALGPYLYILPDHIVYNTATDTVEPVAKSWSGIGVTEDGYYAGEEAEMNEIYAAGVNWATYFRPGDAVTIMFSDTTTQSSIIREIGAKGVAVSGGIGDALRFYENVFSSAKLVIGVSRDAPDMDFICENENRLWGCKGDTIRACKLGDPFNWNVYDGVATDSYAVDVGSSGDFTGCASYLGYPVFFKEENIYKVYGDRPANFQVMGSATLGVKVGSAKSIAIAGETMYYLSRAGFVSYSGGLPQQIASAFGDMEVKAAVGGSDGLKYFASAQIGSAWNLFIYDTRSGLWHREDVTQAKYFAYSGGILWLTADGKLWRVGGTDGTEESAFTGTAEFGDFTWGPNWKNPTRLLLRLSGAVTVSVQYNSSGTWESAATLTATEKTSRYFPVPIRRCDHYRVKISGTAPWKLWSMTQEYYAGSARE